MNGESGAVHRVCFDSNKFVISNTIVIDLNSGLQVNHALGITIDPASDPAGEIYLYIAYAITNTAPFNGRIARAVSTDGGVSYIVDETFMTGLAHSSFDHQTNGLDFGPDGDLLVDGQALMVSLPDEELTHNDLEELGWRVYSDEEMAA